MILTFKVQGSQPEPYTVTFRKEGRNITATCTCQAGRNKMYCKHRLNLLVGDVTNLVSDNLQDVGLLMEMYQDSDVADIYEEVLRGYEGERFYLAIRDLTPSTRRKRVQLDVANEVLAQGGFLKAYDRTNYFDIYSPDKQYLGSIQTPFDYFEEPFKELFPGAFTHSFTYNRRGLYVVCGERLHRMLDYYSKVKENLRKLRVALAD